MKIQQRLQYRVFWRDIMQQFWHMVKQVRVRLIQWKDSSILDAIHNEELYQDQWNKFSNILKSVKAELHLWLGPLICKFTMNLFQIC
jgi:hypothetical protein